MNILIIDEQRLFAEGLKNMLKVQQRVTNVYLCSDEQKAADIYTDDNIDLVICDITYPVGLDVISEARKKIKKSKLLVLSGTTNPGMIKQALKMGAHAFVSKNTTIDELMEGITEAFAGRKFISKNIRSVLINALINKEDDQVSSISAKEKEVLIALCEGKTIKEIGVKMRISAHTISYYQRSMMKKIQVSRTLDLILYAVKKGIYVYERDFAC